MSPVSPCFSLIYWSCTSLPVPQSPAVTGGMGFLTHPALIVSFTNSTVGKYRSFFFIVTIFVSKFRSTIVSRKYSLSGIRCTSFRKSVSVRVGMSFTFMILFVGKAPYNIYL